MAANDHLRPEQMKLFMTGTELKGAITSSIDKAPMQSMSGLWDRKRKESKRTGMGHGHNTYQSIKEQGWQGSGPGIHHVRTFGAIPEFDKDDLSIDDAHHRVAAAADIEQRSKGKRNIWIPTTNRYEYPSMTRSDKYGPAKPIVSRSSQFAKFDPEAM
jgi:hypothetical protein